MIRQVCRPLVGAVSVRVIRPASWAWALTGLIVMAASTSPAVAQERAGSSDSAADHGRRLYQHGLTRDGQEITAWVGPGARLPGTLSACTRCHGVSGRGSRDAGLQVPPLRWSDLTQSRASGTGLLARPAYDEATLLRALRQGIDSQGRPLAAAMPRFELSDRAAADLVQHLRRMGTSEDRHPGVESDRVTLGTVLPPGAAATPAGQALVAAARACLDKANREGGIHGRTLEFRVLEGESASIERVPPWAEEVLMLVAPWWPQGSAARLSRQFGPLPVLGPLGAASELLGASEWWFGVVPVPSDQVRIAVDQAAKAGVSGRVLVVTEQGALADAVVQAAQSQAALYPGLRAELLTWPSPDAASGRALWTRALAQPDPPVAVVAVVGAPVLATLAEEMDRSGLPPQALLFGLAQQAGAVPLGWPASRQSRLRLISASVGEADFNPRAFEADLGAQGARPHAPAVQAPAYAAGCAAVEALRRAGRDLDREQLLQGLTAIQRLATGVMPPLSYGPRQRHGVWQSRVLRVGGNGQTFEAETGWESPKLAL